MSDSETTKMPDHIHYKITLWEVDFRDNLPISASEFEEIQAAKRQVVFGLGVEEKFDLVVENYRELERNLLDSALEYSLSPGRIGELIDDSCAPEEERTPSFILKPDHQISVLIASP